MKRAVLASLPSPRPEPAIPTADAYNLTVPDLMQRLSESRSKIEDDVLAGLPHIDIGVPRRRPDGLPPARRKRVLRFAWCEVVEWYRQRNVNGGRP